MGIKGLLSHIIRHNNSIEPANFQLYWKGSANL